MGSRRKRIGFLPLRSPVYQLPEELMRHMHATLGNDLGEVYIVLNCVIMVLGTKGVIQEKGEQ